MNNKKTTILLIIIIVLIAGAIVFELFKLPVKAPTNPTSIQNPLPKTSLQTYKNSSYNFEFQYPNEFSFITPAGYSMLGPDAEQIVQVQADGTTNFPGTNLADYAFTISNQYNTADCLKSVNDKSPLTQTQIINGTTFYKDTTTGAGAGNFYDSQIFRTVRDNWCYELTLTVHTSNIGNYTPGTVTQVDENKVFDILNKILLTFKFN